MQRTVLDWLERARLAGDGAGLERALDAAVAQVRSAWEWLTVLRAVAAIERAPRERLRDVADRTLLAAVEDDQQVWCFRDVAKIRATMLDDADGARAALAAGMKAFTDHAFDGYQFAILAQGYIEALADAEGARRCLDAGCQVARSQRSVDGLCSMARAAAQLGDREAGMALLEEAEALQAGGSARAWSIANVWHEWGVRAAAARVLDAGLENAESCEDALTMARAWASHRDVSGGVDRAMERARALATTAEEWCDVAELARDVRRGDREVREALDRAAALVAESDEDARARVAAAFYRWLGDEEAADRLGPRGVRPAALRTAARRLDGWHGSASALFDWLRARVSREVLEQVAQADYGHSSDKHLAALIDICASGQVPRRMPWHPGEVVALTRWSDGQRVDHATRALCCTLLLLSADDDGMESTAAILVESCIELGEQARDRAEQFFVWICESSDPRLEGEEDDEAGREEEEEDEGAEPLALLSLILLRVAGEPCDERVGPLVSALVHHQSCTAEQMAETLGNCLRADLWRHLIEQLLLPAGAVSEPIAELLAWLRPPA